MFEKPGMDDLRRAAQRLGMHPSDDYLRAVCEIVGPLTQAYALLDAMPDLSMSGRRREPAEGEIPNPVDPPSGCSFHPRCPHVKDRCRLERPRPLAVNAGWVACHAVEEGRI